MTHNSQLITPSSAVAGQQVAQARLVGVDRQRLFERAAGFGGPAEAHKGRVRETRCHGGAGGVVRGRTVSVQAATTLMRAERRERGFRLITIRTSWSSAVR